MGRPVSKVRIFNKEDLAIDIDELLELPPHHTHNPKMGKGYKIATAVINAMKSAIERGEVINIPGFGRFIPYETKPKKNYAYYFNGPMRKGEKRHSEFITLPSKFTVKFKPSPSLKEFVNEGYREELDV